VAQVGSHGQRLERRLSEVDLPPKDCARDRHPSAAGRGMEFVPITSIPGSSGPCPTGRAPSRPGRRRDYDARPRRRSVVWSCSIAGCSTGIANGRDDSWTKDDPKPEDRALTDEFLAHELMKETTDYVKALGPKKTH
jgi:hypothetical protein